MRTQVLCSACDTGRLILHIDGTSEFVVCDNCQTEIVTAQLPKAYAVYKLGIQLAETQAKLDKAVVALETVKRNLDSSADRVNDSILAVAYIKQALAELEDK